MMACAFSAKQRQAYLLPNLFVSLFEREMVAGASHALTTDTTRADRWLGSDHCCMHVCLVAACPFVAVCYDVPHLLPHLDVVVFAVMPLALQAALARGGPP